MMTIAILPPFYPPTTIMIELKSDGTIPTLASHRLKCDAHHRWTRLDHGYGQVKRAQDTRP